MNTFLAGAVFYIVIVWVLVIIPLLIAGIALLITGIKNLKAKKKNKKKAGPIICAVVGAILFVASSTAIIVPAIWWIQYYNEAIETDKNYQKRFESQSEHPKESEEVYLIY